jgi:hypothetical protein
MYINVIDYRGDDKIINARGDTLFEYRTKYFLRMQKEFGYWKQHGHKFRCFTQHNDNNYDEFDDVVKIARGNAAFSRNQVLNFYRKDLWIAILDNDCSLYWDKLDAKEFVQNVEQVIDIAEEQKITSFVPFNPLVQPYLKKTPAKWSFKPQLVQNAFVFCKVDDFRNDETLTTCEDLDIGCQMALAGRRVAKLENISLRSMVNGKSTIFHVNAYHKDYDNLNPNANAKGLLKYDAQLDRKDKYQMAKREIEDKYKMTIEEISIRHKLLWQNK